VLFIGGQSGTLAFVNSENETLMSKLFVGLKSAVIRVLRDEDGQGLAEYALILGLVAVVAIVALNFLSGGVQSELTTVANSL
jgi:pilus assembly protein Flp/PilA